MSSGAENNIAPASVSSAMRTAHTFRKKLIPLAVSKEEHHEGIDKH